MSLFAVLVAVIATTSAQTRAETGKSEFSKSTVTVGAIGTGYLRNWPGHQNSEMIYSVEPKARGNWKFLDGVVDLTAYVYAQKVNTLTVEGSDFYLATNELLLKHHQLTVGRVKTEWSVADSVWKTGLWSPRFMWNQLHPQELGFTGVTYDYKQQVFELKLFGSYLSIPERGVPFVEQGGKLVSPSRDWLSPATQMIMMNQSMNINYQIKYPPLNDLILFPNAAAKVRFGKESGFWSSLGYTYKPLNQTDLSVEAEVSAKDLAVYTKLHPRRLFHHLATAEAGFESNSWNLWTSFTAEKVVNRPPPVGTWMVQPIASTVSGAWGTRVKSVTGFEANLSFLMTESEKLTPIAGAIPLDLPKRLTYTQAVNVGGRFDSRRNWSIGVNEVYDLKSNSGLTSVDGVLAFQSGLGLSAGADLVNARSDSSSGGFLDTFAGNDRFWGKVSYAF